MSFLRITLTICFGTLLCTQSFTDKKCITDEYMKDSEFGYYFQLGAHATGRYISKCQAYYKNGNVYKIIGYTYPIGGYKEETFSENYQKYKKFWEELEIFNIWEYCSVTPGEYPGEDPEIILELYKKLRMEKSSYKFFFSINKKKYSFMVYDIFQLKDEKYLKILEEINKFFGFRTFVE